MADPVMSRFETLRLDRALNESWRADAATTPDRKPIRVRVRVVCERSGEEWQDGYAFRWSGRSVFVSLDGRSRNGSIGVWLDADDVMRA